MTAFITFMPKLSNSAMTVATQVSGRTILGHVTPSQPNSIECVIVYSDHEHIGDRLSGGHDLKSSNACVPKKRNKL